MKDLAVMATGVLILVLVVFGVVQASDETSQGSNSKNGANFGPPLPPGVSVPR